jgi:UDP-N-acetylmuramate--alanine ligase
VVAFQPHRYTRTQALMEEFGRAFFEADVVFLTDIYAASEHPLPGVTGEILAETLRQHGQRDVRFVADVEELPKELKGATQPGDLVITFGAGSITHAGPAFLAL